MNLAKVLKKYQNGGEISPVIITAQKPRWAKYSENYKSANSLEKEIQNAKNLYNKEALRIGVPGDIHPDELKKTEDLYNWKHNNYIAEKLIKDKIQPKDLTSYEKELISNSDYRGYIEDKIFSPLDFNLKSNTLVYDVQKNILKKGLEGLDYLSNIGKSLFTPSKDVNLAFKGYNTYRNKLEEKDFNKSSVGQFENASKEVAFNLATDPTTYIGVKGLPVTGKLSKYIKYGLEGLDVGQNIYNSKQAIDKGRISGTDEDVNDKKKYGGLMKNYSFGGDILKGVGAGAYGIGEGLIDNITFGLTDGITDKGYEALSKVGKNSTQFQKTSNIIRGSGNIVGQVGGAVLTGGATTTQAISGGLKGANTIVQNTNMNDKAKQWIGLGTKVGGMAAGLAGGGLNGDIANAPQGLQEIMNFSKGLQGSSKLIQGSNGTYDELNGTIQFAKYGGSLMKNYQMGGNLPQNIMPQNPNDLQAVTENTMEFNGNSHKSGGIPLNNGAELEKDETVIKQGAIGNKDPYAISPNLVLDRETAKLVGLPSKYAGMKLSDISRKIEDMKAAKENDAMSEKTNSMNKKFALNSLIKANELLSAQHRKEQGVNEMSDLRQEEMAQMRFGGKFPNGGGMPDDFMDYYRTHPDYTGLNDEMYKNADSWKSYEPDYLQWKKNNPAFTIGKDYPNFYNAQTQLPEQKNLSQSLDLARVTSNNPTTNFTDYIKSGAISGNPSSELGDLAKPKSKSFDLKSNLGNIGMGLKGASLLANFATIGKKPGQIPAQFNPYATDILNNYRNTIDNQAIKNDVTSVLNTGLNANPSRNWNVQRAINSDLVGRSMDAMSKANLQNQELNNRYRTELGTVQNNLGQQNVQAKNMAEVLNAQTQANWRNNLRSAIGNVGNDVADMLIQKQFVQDATKDGMALTKEKIKILQNKWGSSFGADSDKFMDMLQAVFPSYTKEQLTKIASE